MDKIKTFLSKRLLTFILTPILTGLIIAANAVLPENAALSQEQISEIVKSIIQLAMATVAGFSIQDAAKEIVTNKKNKETATSTPTASDVEVMDNL